MGISTKPTFSDVGGWSQRLYIIVTCSQMRTLLVLYFEVFSQIFSNQLEQ
jgi:hypothetical protein